MARTARKNGTKAEQIAEQIARAVGAGRTVAVETVDFGDPQRAKTCLEVDFPILPVNQVAWIEGAAGKPVYQMSKWWARRRSSVFRTLLLAGAMKAPDDPAKAAKAVWDVYYANHQAKGALSHLKVADIFMGGGVTVVEGARLGMQMFGADLNPVAWFVVKNELARVSADEVQALLADIEAEVKPQIMPFYACDCPRGHRGTWTHVPSGKVMESHFDPLALKREERAGYRYAGPEIIYVFWAKHGPCQVTGCGHRTPVMSSPVVAVKTLTVKARLGYRCRKCSKDFDVEAADARMAPGVPLVVAADEKPFAVHEASGHARCPHCGHRELVNLSKPKRKKVELSLVVHPQWLAGSPKVSADGCHYGGSATDTPQATAVWNQERARTLRLVEVRGDLPDDITCPVTHVTFSTRKGTIPRKSHFECRGATCGRAQDVLKSVKASGKTGPVAPYIVQGYCPACDHERQAYGGRFFAPVTDTILFDAAAREWEAVKEADLAHYWPRSPLPYGLEADFWSVRSHGYTHWWMMFNPRQLLVHAQLLKAIATAGAGSTSWDAREFVLAAFQQYLRNQCMFSLWNSTGDKLEPQFSKNNFRPKATTVENCVFSGLGRGNWSSAAESLLETIEWRNAPWEIASNAALVAIAPPLKGQLSGSSGKVFCGDAVTADVMLSCESATDLHQVPAGSHDLVISDPPFGNLLQYAELSDFFYVWLRLLLKSRYPAQFEKEETPKALEIVSNRARNPEDPDGFYKRLLTEAWREAHRILKPGGLLAFTFHHSEDEPWVAVLDSLFEAGFYLEATFPVRGDETKGEGDFGSQKIEYDIIHVCRKRVEEPAAVSWGRMRREVLQDVRRLQALLEHHAKQGLPAADLQVIKRGKALEYFSRHYGKVYVDEERAIDVRDALVGINQLLDEDAGGRREPPPVTAEPFTRQFLRIFDGVAEQARDQVQKYLRGTGLAPAEFEERGWCRERQKVYYLTPPLDIARAWHGKQRRAMTSDYDQTMFMIGSCFEGSGLNVSDTLRNENFRPHPALAALLEWHVRRGATNEIRNAASRALAIYQSWERSHQEQVRQMTLFYGE